MFFDDSNPVLEILGVFKLRRKNYTHNSNSERYYDSLSLRLSGSCDFESPGGNFSVNEGDILYIPSDIKYKQRTESEELIVIHFVNYNKQEKQAIEIFSSESTARIRAEFERIYDIWSVKKKGYRQMCTSILYMILYLAAESNEKDYGEINRIMNGAVNYIHQNYKKKDIAVSDIAKRMFVSDSYFRRVFKKNYGISPAEYIISLKLEYASELLSSGHYSVSEVAQKAGYDDTKYFSRIFKKRFSKTPTEYKKQNIAHYDR